MSELVIKAFAEADISTLASRLRAIPIAHWPKMADPESLGCAEDMRAIADSLMGNFQGCKRSAAGLFLLLPSQEHPVHTDEQPPEWVTRVHVPVITNDKATATTDDGTIHMKTGIAYTFDTRRSHTLNNGGTEPRVHLVFDVRSK